MGAFIDLTGRTFGKLTVLHRADRRGNAGLFYWTCDCACGAVTETAGRDLRIGDSTSCGCLLTLNPKWSDPTYVSWVSAKQRCQNPNNYQYASYGGRGIKHLLTYEELLADIGPRPEGRSLDRIDNDGDYAVGNVRWATPREQANNRRDSAPTHCPHGHEYTDDNTVVRTTPQGGRAIACKTCKKRHMASWHARNKDAHNAARREAYRRAKESPETL